MHRFAGIRENKLAPLQWRRFVSEYELPSGWSWVTLEDVVESVRNGISTKPVGHAGVSILRISAVRAGALDTTDVRYLPGDVSDYADFIVQPDDVLFTRYNGNADLVGAAARVPSGVTSTVYPDKLIRVRPITSLIEPKYLEAASNVGPSRRHIESHSKSAAGQVGISGADLKKTPIPLPPSGEQRRIVAKLHELRTRSRKAREALDEVPALLEQLKQSVLAAAFRGDLTAEWRAAHPNVEPASVLLERIRAERRRRWDESNPRKPYGSPEPIAEHLASDLWELPPSWSWASVSEVVSSERPLCYGVVQPGADEGDVPLVRVCDVDDRMNIDASSLRRISSEVAAEYSRSRLTGGEVLVSVVGTIGRIAVVPDFLAGANIARALARIAPHEPINGCWIALALQSDALARHLVRESREVARKTLNLGDLAGIPIPLAPPEEMDAIIAAVTRSFRTIHGLLDAVRANALELDELDRTVLAKAFRGELVPQDPNDEPAEILLARLRAEAGATPTRKPRGRARRTEPS